MIYQIDFIGAIYTDHFYAHIVPQTADCIYNHYEKELVFNFVDLEFLSPNIVPNLLNIAEIYKRLTNGRTITLTLSWNTKLLSYLDSVHFFLHADNLSLFNYNHEMVGGFSSYSTKDNCNLIFSEVNSSEDEINRNVHELMRSKAIYKKLDKEYEEDCDNIKEVLFHLLHNANEAERGNSNAYGLFEINRYKTGAVAYISICDSGVGLSHTLNDKFRNKIANPYFAKDQNTTTFYYILEALFWRKIHSSRFIHGLYHVSKMVLKKGGKIGIHSNDMHVLFPRYFRNTFDTIAYSIGENEELDRGLQNSLRSFARRNTPTRLYEGVHIYLELPLGEKK